MIPLIVRPQPAAIELAGLLEKHGHQPVVFPLLSYLPGDELEQLPAALLHADIVIATSGAATEFACQYFHQHQVIWPDTIRYLAVGATTARPWQQDGLTVRLPHPESSEGLLAMPELQQVGHQNILLLRGESGRELLSEKLTAAGANVTPLMCYRRHYVNKNGQELYSLWQAKQIDSVIITSYELFQHLISLLPAEAGKWLSGLIWFAASERIAKGIQQAGFPSVIIMSGARHEAVLAALEQQLEEKHDE